MMLKCLTHGVFQGVRPGAVGNGSDLTVGGVAEELALRILHGAGDGPVHEAGHTQLGDGYLPLQNRVLDQGEAGRSG